MAHYRNLKSGNAPQVVWGTKSGTADGDRLDVLATLIDAYETEHYPMDPPDPIEAIKFRMEQQGLSRKDLEPLIGTRTRVAEVLNRKRSLSIAMIGACTTSSVFPPKY